MNVLNEEIRALRMSIESKKRYLRENELVQSEKDKINLIISKLQEELNNRLEKVN